MASNDKPDSPVDDEDTKFIEEAFENGGVAAVNAVVLRMNKWKKLTINVGITGNSGVGKSSFVNALRGCEADDVGAAAVGCVETTMVGKSYKHPSNENMLLWDLPGVGTPKFKQDTYLEKIYVDRYDYFMILSCSRFTENDQWLGQELKKRGKTFYFVRTKLDQDIQNDKRSHKKTHDETKVIESIRKDCRENLKKIAYEVYLIAAFDTDTFDFPALEKRLVIDAPALKRQAVLLTIRCKSKDMILEKKQALTNRIYRLALLSTLGGVLPLPFVGAAIDTAVIECELKFYKEQFGLSETSSTSSLYNMSSKGIEAFIVKHAEKKLHPAKWAATWIIPLVGAVVNGVDGYAHCYFTLKTCLDAAVEDAIALGVKK